MPESCRSRGCKNPVPLELEAERICVPHYLIGLEETCAELRREGYGGNVVPERRAEMERYITDQGERLARLGTGALRISDDIKARILNNFLMLINLRESLDRGVRRPA